MFLQTELVMLLQIVVSSLHSSLSVSHLVPSHPSLHMQVPFTELHETVLMEHVHALTQLTPQ